MTKANCSECGHEFEKKSDRGSVCSHKCGVRRWRRLNPERNKANYTAWTAANKDRVSRYNSEAHLRYMNGRPDAMCAQCGNPFRPWGQRIYCSAKCLNKARGRYESSKQARKRYVQTHKEYYLSYQRNYERRNNLAYPWRRLLDSAKNRVRKKGLLYDLTEEWAKERWTGRCELTGIEFSTRHDKDFLHKHAFRPSIDRITPSKGYVQDNCRFILFALNSMKADATDESMYLIAEALLKNRFTSAPHMLTQERPVGCSERTAKRIRQIISNSTPPH